MDLSKYLNAKNVRFLSVNSREEALKQLTDALASSHTIEEKEPFYRALIKREQLVSTGIGMGVALPHAKFPEYEDFFIAIGIQRGSEGIEWDSLDGSLVRIVLLIGGPDYKQNDYLKLLSQITAVIKDPQRRRGLYQAADEREVIQILKQKSDGVVENSTIH